MNPGIKVVYTKDNIKYFGYVLSTNIVTGKNTVSIIGSEDILELDDSELEELI